MNTHLSLVNQKFGFATAALSLAENYSESPSIIEKLQQRALYESTVHHLYVAFHFYLRELAESNGIKNPGAVDSLQSLIMALGHLEKHPSEVIELQGLAITEGSWLNSLLLRYEQIFESPPKKAEKKAFGSENLIKVVEVDSNVGRTNRELSAEDLKVWLEEFKTLALRQRETSAEY